MLEIIKARCGIMKSITVYDEDIGMYIEDCQEDMKSSGVSERTIQSKQKQVATAVTLYVKANIGNDRTDTEKYMELYRRKVFRLTLEEEV